MKRLFNLLLSLLMAIGFNIDVAWRDNTYTYTPDGFYHATTDGHSISTRAYDSGKYETNSELCTASTKQVSGARTITTEPYTTYWIGASLTEMNLDTSQVTLVKNDVIVAPFDCEVVQVNTGTPIGITAYFGFTIDYEHYYILQVENMERLYCCRNRGRAPEAGWLSHSLDVTGNKLHAGDMLGIAGENTIARLYIGTKDYTLAQSIGAGSSEVPALFGTALR